MREYQEINSKPLVQGKDVLTLKTYDADPEPDVVILTQEEDDSLQHVYHNNQQKGESEGINNFYSKDPTETLFVLNTTEDISNTEIERDSMTIQDMQNNNCENGMLDINTETTEAKGKSNEEKMMLEKLISMVQSKINFAKESK